MSKERMFPRRRRQGRWTERAALASAVAIGALMAMPAVAGLWPSPGLPTAVVRAAQVRLDKPSAPVRVRVPSAGIDLAVISSERKVRGNPPGDTPCDVALYWTKYGRPGTPGTTWIYAHAQPGMFLPLFTISEATDGTGLVGDRVELQLRDGRLLTYRITRVKERALTERIARAGLGPDEQRLVLQTSTGPKGTKPKLQVSATLVDATRTDQKPPPARPRACWRSVSGDPSNRRNDQGTAPQAIEVIEPDASIDAMTLVLGSGAVLLGATSIAVWLVRRQP